MSLQKEGTILLYDDSEKAFRPMSYEELFARFDKQQKEALEELTRQSEELRSERIKMEAKQADAEIALNKKVEDFASEMQKDYSAFLKKYQDSMSTLTELVKAAIKE